MQADKKGILLYSGEQSLPFIGAVAALRIWDAALDPHDIITFAMKDINDTTGQHPELDALVGMSDFRNNGFFLSGYELE